MNSQSKKAKRSNLPKQKSKDEEQTQNIPPLTLSKIKKILESATYKANKDILLCKDFIKQSKKILNQLSVEERYNFLNNHLNETKLNKWNDKKSKFMSTSNCSFQHTPLSVSWYNFTYQHTSIEASKIWYEFINLMIDFKQGSAECDLFCCSKPDCKRHLTIIDQLYSFVNTSDESLYAISTPEFTQRGGFKLLLKIFNNGGVNNPIPPLILCCDEYKQHEFLSHFVELNYNFLFAISPNEVRFSWIKQMLRNGHPIMSQKQYVAQLLQKFYPKRKKVIEKEETDELFVTEDDDTEDVKDENKLEEYEISKTAYIDAASMDEVGVLSWLLATLPNLLNVRQEQKQLLKREFDKYEETAANLTLIDTMLDYLYWEESYINSQICNIGNIIMENKNELILFRYISSEYSGNVAMTMFIKQFIDIHINNNRDTIQILFGGDKYENNLFYVKLIKHMYGISSMVSRLDQYFPFLLNKVIWDEIDQLLFDKLLSSILSYIERYVSNKSMMMKIRNKLICSSKSNGKKEDILSKLVDVKREKTKKIALKWIINILKLCNNDQYTAQIVYHLGVLHFKTVYQNEYVEKFTLQLFEELTKNKFDIDSISYFLDSNTHISKELTVTRSECILWLLCRCCFDKAINIFLFKYNPNNKMNQMMIENLFVTRQIGNNGKCNNIFLNLSQSRMSDSVTNTQRVQNARVNIFKMLCKYGNINGVSIDDIKKCLLQKDEINGKNSLQYASENNYQSLCNEMKQFMS